MFALLKKKKVIPVHIQAAQDLVVVDEINDNILYTTTGYIFAYLSIRAMSADLLAAPELQIATQTLAKELGKEQKPWQLLSYPRTINTDKLIEHVAELKRNTKQNARLELLNAEIEYIKSMAHNGAKEPMLVLKIWEKEEKQGEVKLNKRIHELQSSLKPLQGYEVERLQDKDIAFFCKQLADLGIPQDDDITAPLYPVLEHEETPEPTINLIDEITPYGGIEKKKDSMQLGNAHVRFYGVREYPNKVDYNWLTAILNNVEAVTAITFDPGHTEMIASHLSGAIKTSALKAESSKDYRKGKSYRREVKAADALIDTIDEDKKQIGLMNIVTMPYCTTDEDFEDVCKRTVTLFANKRIKLSKLNFLQEQALRTITPYHTPAKEIDMYLTRLMPMETFAGGFPFCIDTYQDENGFYFAKTSTGNIVSLDLWYRGGTRTNSNFFLLGKPGAGKSTILKHILQTEFMSGTKILINDPEREVAEMAQHLGGTTLNMGGGKWKINPFDVRAAPTDLQPGEDGYDETEKPLYSKEEQGNILAMHIRNLKMLFKPYFKDAGELLLAIFEKMVIECYRSFHITWDTDFSKLKPADYPIMRNLYNHAAEAQKQASSEQEKNMLEELCSRLYSAAYGADQFIFNGHTNVDLSNDIILFDTRDLQGASETLRGTQYLNIGMLAWEVMQKETRRVLFVSDEFYLVVDQNQPEAVMFYRNIGKRCRKLEAALGIATQSAVDLMHPNVKQYGQGIMDLPTYKFFLNADGQNLKEIADLYSLTEKQQNILHSSTRGECLAMFGSTMLHLDFEIPQYKLERMGTAGGR